MHYSDTIGEWINAIYLFLATQSTEYLGNKVRGRVDINFSSICINGWNVQYGLVILPLLRAGLNCTNSACSCVIS